MILNGPVVALCLCAFALLGSLPFVFFRRGSLTRGWWLTATPFFLDAAVLLAALARVVTHVIGTAILAWLAVPLAASAMALTGSAVGANRVPLAMWHQENDASVTLVTWGPYGRIRHPLYTSFILMLSAAAAAVPHPATFALLLLGALQLHRTARREERRLLRSDLGPAYADYMRHTGRFVPRLAPSRANG